MNPKEIGALKSSTAVVKQFRDMLEAGLLNPDEEIISEPSGFINVLMSQIGESSSTAFFEQQMIKNEALASTAILNSSLFRQLNSEELSSYFGAPSSLTFVIGYDETELLKAGILQANGEKLLRLNKKMKMSIGSLPEFTVDYDIEIIVSNPNSEKYTIYARYDTSNLNESISPISSPFIPSRRISYSGKKYFTMYITMRQYERNEKVAELSGTDFRQNFFLGFNHHLMGFEVLYQPDDQSDYQRLLGEPTGIQNLAGFNFNVTQRSAELGGGGQVEISFSRSPNALRPSKGRLKFVSYDTLGAQGNFELKNLESEVNGIALVPSQDRSDDTQEALTSLVPLVSIKTSKAINGRDQMTTDELRKYIISRNRSGGKVISPGEIERKAVDVGLSAAKTRSDSFGLEFRLSGSVVGSEGLVVPTVSKSLAFALGQTAFDVNDSPLWKPLVNALAVTPKTIFSLQDEPLTSDDNTVDLVATPDLDSQYVTRYNSGDQDTDFVFPFVVRIVPSENIDVKVYDTHRNDSYITDFEFFNEDSQDRASITGMTVLRDPIKDNFFKIYFDVNVGDNIAAYELNRIKNASGDPEALICKMTFESLTDSNIIRVGRCQVALDIAGQPLISGNLIRYEMILHTDDSITDTGKIMIAGQSIEPIPFESNPIGFYTLEAKTKVRIHTILKTTGGAPRPISPVEDYVLRDDEIVSGYYVSTVYFADEVDLFTDISEIMRIQPDLKVTQPTFKRYVANVPATYEKDEYDTNPDGSYKSVTVNVMIPNSSGVPVSTDLQQLVVLHHAGDVIMDGGNPVIAHNAGDLILDANGNSQIDIPSTKILILRSVPVYDRIFSIDHYEDIVMGYRSLISRVTALANIVPDGCKLTTSVRKTFGPGNWRLKDPSGIDPVLDSIALSFSLGYKLVSNAYGVDTSYISQTIVNAILQYVNSYTEFEFSVNKMLETIKRKIPTIDYFEFYDLNHYSTRHPGSSRFAQTIYVPVENLEKASNESLCVHYKAERLPMKDASGAIIPGQFEVVFTPDIDVKIIN